MGAEEGGEIEVRRDKVFRMSLRENIWWLTSILDVSSKLSTDTHVIFPNQIAPIFSVPSGPLKTRGNNVFLTGLCRESEAQYALPLYFLLGRGML